MAGDPFTGAIFRWLKAVAADPTQSPAAFEAAFVISQRINRTSKIAWPSQETLADDLGLSGNDEARVRQVRRAVKCLTDGGYLLTRRRKQSSTVYLLAQDRTPLSYQEEETENGSEAVQTPGVDSRPDNYVLSSDQDRTSVSARPDNTVRKTGHQCPPNHLTNHLGNHEGERRSRARPIPEDWKLSDEDHDFALGEGVADIGGMAGAFADYYRANGTTKADWSAAWRSWVRRESKFNPPGADPILAKLRNAAAVPLAAASDQAWDQVLALFAKTGVWTRHIDVFGNAPPSPNCRAPRHLLIKHGILKEAAA